MTPKPNLNEYGVSARYPDALYEPSIDETRRAYETAKEIRALVLENSPNTFDQITK